MLLSPRKNGLTSLFKEVRVFKEGAPRNHPEISSQNLADFERRCPYDSYGKIRAPFWPLFGRRMLGQHPAAPSSFRILLKFSKGL